MSQDEVASDADGNSLTTLAQLAQRAVSSFTGNAGGRRVGVSFLCEGHVMCLLYADVRFSGGGGQ